MSRMLVFGALLTVTLVAGVVAWRSDPSFREGLAAQIFWLALGTTLVTFVLEKVLEADSLRRRRESDRLAFRTFTASLMIALAEVASLKDTREAELLGAAVGGKERFAEAARAAARAIETSGGFSHRGYLKHSGWIERELRGLSVGYIRLLAKSEAGMVERFRTLSRLADRWPYVDAFTESAIQYAEQDRNRVAEAEAHLERDKRRLEAEEARQAEEAGAAERRPEDREWLEDRRRRLGEQEESVARDRARVDEAAAGAVRLRQEAIEACRDTARTLAELAEFVARSQGVPPPG